MSTHRLSADLYALLLAGGADGVSLRDIVATAGRRGYGLMLIVLSLPSAMPVPAPGYSTPFGIILFLIGLQIFANRRTPWLPEWALRRRISSDNGRRMVEFVAACLSRIERWIRPRHEWVFGGSGNLVAAVLTLFMAVLMIFPIPLTNTAPALVIFAIGIGLVEKDGLLLGVAAVFGVLAALFYIGVFLAIFYFGLQGVEEVKEIIRGWF